ncbi:MAG: PAS domain S-box protein [Holophagaceae bacterium]
MDTLSATPVPLGSQASPLGRTRWRPDRGLLRSFLLVSILIVAIEFLIMVVLEPFFKENHRAMAWVDATVLILVCGPAMYYLLVRPMARSLFLKAEADRAVTELQATNLFLRQDAELRIQTQTLERTRSDARIEFQARILAVVQQAVVATGRGGAILYWNRYAEWLFGWAEAEVLNQTLAKVTGFTAEAARAGLGGVGAVKGWTGEVRALRRDGGHFPAYLTCSPIWRNDGSVAGFVYTFMDITDRKAAELAIRDSEEKYSTVVENSPTGVFIYKDGKIVFGNQRFFQMVGRSMRELRDMDLVNLVHPEDWATVNGVWRRRVSGELASRDSEYRIIHSTGEVRWVSGRTAVIRYSGEIALLGNIQDITERHKAEESLRDSREALHRLSAKLMSAQETERRRVAQELHDSLGQSLSAVKFMVEQALDDQEARGVPEGLCTSLRAVVPVIQGAVEEVRRISMALRPTTLDDLGLLATIAWFTREFHTTYPHMTVERIIEVEEFEIPESFKTNVFRILQEAMNNAAKYSRATHIMVALRQVLGDLQLIISDNGVGFDLSGVRTSPSATGGGYGLVSMRERTELFGGSLIITSSAEEGTMILARWPLPEDAIS